MEAIMSDKKRTLCDSGERGDSRAHRRDFLKGLAAVSGASVIAAAMPPRAAGAEPAAGTTPTVAPATDAPPSTKDTFGIKPREIPFAPASHADKDTGRRVTRLFPAGQQACHAYFTSTSYDGAGRLVLSAQVDGRYQLVRADLRRGTLQCLTDLSAMRAHSFCVCPAKDLAIVNDGGRFVRVDLATGACKTILSAPKGFNLGLPTVDAAGKRIAFVVAQEMPGLPTANVIYSGMPQTFYSRPHCLIVTVNLDDDSTAVVWGETEWISHVLISPVDPDTIVFCHEGGNLADNRLWVVDARPYRKKHAKCLYPEKYEEWLVHEYFCKDGTVGVQITEYDPSDATQYASKAIYTGILFLKTDGRVVARYKLPGWRCGHMQSNSGNSVIVGDGYLPKPDSNWKEGGQYLSLNYPEGDRLRVERLCHHGTSWRTQESHPHPIFSPDDRQVLFSAEVEASNSVYVVDL
jgi:oligogalacturonide lyase